MLPRRRKTTGFDTINLYPKSEKPNNSDADYYPLDTADIGR